MAATYKAQVLRWDWMAILRDTMSDARGHDDRDALHNIQAYEGCDGDGHVGYSYLGSVMSIYPSGKFWMPWTSNQTNDDMDRDSRFTTALDAVATKHGGWIESGEGDPTDLYFARYWSIESLDTDA